MEGFMKILGIVLFFISSSAFALDAYEFNCDLDGNVIQSIPGAKPAPEHPVVGLKIKVLQNDNVPLYMMKATSSVSGNKNIFVTDWIAPSELSQDGLDLLQLLQFFMGIDTSNLESLRAGLPTDLLDTFAYLELKDQSGLITKLGFDGTTPYTCQ